jgi:hypothetical protein
MHDVVVASPNGGEEERIRDTAEGDGEREGGVDGGAAVDLWVDDRCYDVMKGARDAQTRDKFLLTQMREDGEEDFDGDGQGRLTVTRASVGVRAEIF